MLFRSWGMPHVFAVFLIVAASGALNTASIASVFDQAEYKPLARLSGLLAIALLLGGLAVLVLDLGRPDRLTVAMTSYNFKSIFAWNIFLYTGFLAVVAIYLWLMFEPRMNRFIKPVGTFALAWRLVLTTATGSIFGFLVAREAFDSAIMAPMFILMSLSFGTALMLIVCLLMFCINGTDMGEERIQGLRRLLGYFVFFFNDTATTEIYTLSLHDALPISSGSATSSGRKVRPDPPIPMASGFTTPPNCRRLMTMFQPFVVRYLSKRAGTASWASTLGRGPPLASASAMNAPLPPTWSRWPWV